VFGLIALLGGCGGGGGSPAKPNTTEGLPDLGLDHVVTENEAAREATIGRDGGSLSATGENGVVYTLTIPEDALSEETVIGIYPVGDVTNVPGGGHPVGGVHMVPEGLKFQIAATLTMQYPSGVVPRDFLNVSYQEDSDNPFPAIAANQGQASTVVIQHFSGTFAISPSEVLLALGLPAQGAVPFLNRIAAASVGHDVDDPALTAIVKPIYIEWYEQLVRPLLVAGGASSLDETTVDPPATEFWTTYA
jgi:hypothetical protein